MNTELVESKLQELKLAREAAAFYRSEMKAMLDHAKASHNYGVSENSAKQADDTIAILEAELRGLALDEYQSTQNKKPHSAITIKIFKTFRILDTEKVRAWAFGNLPAALKLDEKKVEKYALEFGDVDGTEKGEEARAQIASEL